MYQAAMLFSIACFLVVGFIFVRHRAFSVFHPLTFYLAFHGLLFVFRPVLAYYLDYQHIYQSFEFFPSDSDKLTVILASNLGFLVFAFCSLTAGKSEMRFKQDHFGLDERKRLGTLYPWVLLICVPIGAYSLLSTWNQIRDGTFDMYLDKVTGHYVNTTGNGYLAEAQLMLASASAIFAWIYRFRLFAIMPIVAFVVMRAGTGGRGPYITGLVTMLLLYYYEKRKKFPGMQVVAFVAFLMLSFSVVGADRGQAIRVAIGREQAATQFGAEQQDKFLEGMDFGNLEFFEFIVYIVPQRSGSYDYFLENLQLFTEPIPRILWKDKPIGAPIQMVRLQEYGRAVGMTKSLPGEGWYFFGWPGVVIWCGLWGLGLGYLYRRFAEGPQNALHTATYMVILPVMIVAFRDGTLVTVFRQCIFYLAPIVLWSLLARQSLVPNAQTLRMTAFKKWRRLKRAQQRLSDGTSDVSWPVKAETPGQRRRRAAMNRRPSSDGIRQPL